MCMWVVHKKYSRKKALNKKVHGVGWKSIYVINDQTKFNPPHYGVWPGYDFDKWFEDNSIGHIYSPDRSTYYPKGFHIFKTKRGAQAMGAGTHVVKVHYKEVVAQGFQKCGSYKYRCIVARQYKALKNTLQNKEFKE